MFKTFFTKRNRPVPPIEIAEFINNSDIKIQNKPYRYCVVDNFFTDLFYQELVKLFDKVLERGLLEKDDKSKFSRFNSYDAYGYTPALQQDSPVNLFRKEEWRIYFGQLFGLTFTPDEVLSFHHHLPGSSDGWIHSDYSLCSFVDNPLVNGTNSWFHQCTYEDSSLDKQPGTKKVMRALTMIYYLKNPEENFGGETVVLDKKHNIVDLIAPKNNRLFVFEVSPSSFHSFRQNDNHPRNSITQWFHQDTQTMLNRFDGHEPVRW